jgi:hypothetical protein
LPLRTLDCALLIVGIIARSHERTVPQVARLIITTNLRSSALRFPTRSQDDQSSRRRPNQHVRSDREWVGEPSQDFGGCRALARPHETISQAPKPLRGAPGARGLDRSARPGEIAGKPSNSIQSQL